MAAKIYAGPGKLFFGGTTLWPQQESGKITYVIQQEKNDVASGMRGRAASTLGNTEGKINLTPFDNWGALAALFSTWLGATTTNVSPETVGGTGLIQIGYRPHNPPYGAGADFPATIWNPDGSGLVVNRVAVTKPPELHLGVDKPLFGALELTALPKTSSSLPVAPGAATAFHTISESALSDPSATAGTLSDFVREAWTGAIASGVTGFVSGLEAQEEWTIVPIIKFNTPKKQKQTICYTLASVEFMVKCRPYGPTWTQIETAVVTGRGLGSRWGFPTSNSVPSAAVDLVLTSTSGKTVTLKNVDYMGEGFEFGGTTLNTGEVAFVNQMTETTGVPQPLIIFSA